MTCKNNPIVVVKILDLDISHIYSHNHMVGMDKNYFNEIPMHNINVLAKNFKCQMANSNVNN
jgi:hypothetical protein